MEPDYEVLSAKPHRITWRSACNTLVVEPAGGILPWQFIFSGRIMREIPTIKSFHIAFVVDGRCWMTDDETLFRLAKETGDYGYLLDDESCWRELKGAAHNAWSRPRPKPLTRRRSRLLEPLMPPQGREGEYDAY